MRREQELLSASTVFAVCQDSRVLRWRQLDVSMIEAFSKSIWWFLDQAWFAFRAHFHVSSMFVLPGAKRPSRFTNVAP